MSLTVWSRYFTLHVSRQLVYFRPSRWQHSSIENPLGSVAWDLDVVQDMLQDSKMRYVDTDLCAWGAKDPCSDKFYSKTMQFACTFNVESLMRRCPTDHEHEPVQGVIREGTIQGQESVHDFRAISFAIMRCMGIPCKQMHIAPF